MKPVALLASPVPASSLPSCALGSGDRAAHDAWSVGEPCTAPVLVPAEGGAQSPRPESAQLSLEQGERSAGGEKGLKVNKQSHSNDLLSYSSLTRPH